MPQKLCCTSVLSTVPRINRATRNRNHNGFCTNLHHLAVPEIAEVSARSRGTTVGMLAGNIREVFLGRDLAFQVQKHRDSFSLPLMPYNRPEQHAKGKMATFIGITRLMLDVVGRRFLKALLHGGCHLKCCSYCKGVVYYCCLRDTYTDRYSIFKTVEAVSCGQAKGSTVCLYAVKRWRVYHHL